MIQMDIFSWAAIATIVGNVLMLTLTCVILNLTFRDRQKALSLKELQEQTESLQKSFIELIKPTWSVSNIEHASQPYFAFVVRNVGGSCKDFYFQVEDSEINIKDLHSINNQSYASQADFHCHIKHKTEFEMNREYHILGYFTDIQGNRYSQTLVLMKINSAYPNSIHFTNPQRL